MDNDEKKEKFDDESDDDYIREATVSYVTDNVRENQILYV